MQVYRTEEALFIYYPSRAGAAFRQFFHPALAGSLFMLLFCMLGILKNGIQPDDFAVVPFFVASPFLFFGLAVLAAFEKRLVRIDASHIVFTTWLFGRGSTKRFQRQGKLELSEHKRFPGKWMFKEQPQGIINPEGKCLLLRPHEKVWLRKVFDEFDQEVPQKSREWNESQSLVFFTLSPDKRLEHPAEKHLADEAVAGLVVRCPICHAVLPEENVWFEEAAGQCAECNWVFLIGDLQKPTPPERCRLAFWEDETGLHLHQKPSHFNFLTISLTGLAMFSAVWLYLVGPQERWLPVLFHQELLQTVGIFLFGMAIAVVLSIRTYHIHRFIDFGHSAVRFRTRWLFWERCRTIARHDVGVFYKTDIEFFGGVFIPYGTKRSFYVLTTPTEEAYLVCTVNRWLWQNRAANQRAGNGTQRNPWAVGFFLNGIGEPEYE